MPKYIHQLRDWMELLQFSISVQFGRTFWWFFLGVLLWPLLQALFLLAGLRTSFTPVDTQNNLIGFPLYCLAIGIGIRIIAHEIEKRTLEVCYTVPAGAKRVWLSKLFSASILILIAEIPLAVSISFFFTSTPISALYGAFQGAIFYLVLSMWAGVILRSELMAAMISFLILFLDLSAVTGRWSALFNPLKYADSSAEEILAWSFQNYLSVSIVIIIIASVSFALAEKREKLLAD